jgi:hypothetical protein
VAYKSRGTHGAGGGEKNREKTERQKRKKTQRAEEDNLKTRDGNNFIKNSNLLVK